MTREEAIETIKTAIAEVEWEYPMNYAAAFDMAIEALKKQSKWIPVSERLPKSRTYCLFTVFEHDSELEATTIETVYGCFDDYGERRYWSWEDEFGECCIEGEEQLDGDHDEIIEKVLAWMPLPEPYKERRTDE